MGTPSSPELITTRRGGEASQRRSVKMICFSSSWSPAQVHLKRVHCGSSGTALGFMSTPALTCQGLKVREQSNTARSLRGPSGDTWCARAKEVGVWGWGLAIHSLLEYSLSANVASFSCRLVAPEIGLSS